MNKKKKQWRRTKRQEIASEKKWMRASRDEEQEEEKMKNGRNKSERDKEVMYIRRMKETWQQGRVGSRKSKQNTKRGSLFNVTYSPYKETQRLNKRTMHKNTHSISQRGNDQLVQVIIYSLITLTGRLCLWETNQIKRKKERKSRCLYSIASLETGDSPFVSLSVSCLLLQGRVRQGMRDCVGAAHRLHMHHLPSLSYNYVA